MNEGYGPKRSIMIGGRWIGSRLSNHVLCRALFVPSILCFDYYKHLL